MKRALLVMRYFLSDNSDNKNSYHPKFDDQIDALCQLGYECIYFGIDSHGCLFKMGATQEFLSKIKFHRTPFLRKYFEYKTLYKFATIITKREKFDFIYVRNCPNSLNYPRMMKALRNNSDNVVVEIPTYPPNQEVAKEKRRWIKLVNPFVNLIEKKAAKFVRLFALIGKRSDIYRGKPAVNILNGTNVNGYKKHQKRPFNNEIHMIALAGMAHYHGYDRVIEGMKIFYEKQQPIKFYFHLVGPDADGSLAKWMKMVTEYGLSDYVIAEGPMKGDLLDSFFDKCDLACGSMAGFRRDTHFTFDLKNAEYLSRGIPFICCEFGDNLGFDIPHCYSKIEENNNPVNIEDVLSFAKNELTKDNVSEEMRAYAAKMSWESQFLKIFKELSIENTKYE